MISALLVTAVGSVMSLVTWPLMRAVHREANGVLDAAILLVDGATLLIALWILSRLAAKGARAGADGSPRTVLNVDLLRWAQLVTLIGLFQLLFSFIRSRATTLLVVRLGNATDIDFRSAGWVIMLGVVVPLVLFVVLLVSAANRRAPESV